MADTTVSYKTLLEQCALGHSTALQQLYHLEASHLLALGISLLHRTSDAEELVRESFALIWHHADAYDPNLGSARAWIYSIFRFKALQRLKQSHTLSPFNKPQSRLIIPSTAPASLLPFQRLEEKTRNMLGLAYLHAYSFAEIAKECQSSIKQTEYHIHNALLVLTQIFGDWKSESKEELTLLGLYCLDLLHEPQQLASAQHLLSNNPAAAHDLLLWEEYLSALTHTLNTPTVPASLFERIFQDLGLTIEKKIEVEIAAKTEAKAKVEVAVPRPAPPAPQPQPPKEPKARKTPKQPWNKFYWIITALIIVIAALMLWALMPKAPIIQRIEMSPRAGAILLAPGQSSTPGWIVAVDPAGHVLLTPQVKTEVRAGNAVQLWTQSPESPRMRSLGLLNPNEPVTLPKELIGEVQIGQLFEMTLEPQQGSATPSGPVLFIGRIVSFGES